LPVSRPSSTTPELCNRTVQAVGLRLEGSLALGGALAVEGGLALEEDLAAGPAGAGQVRLSYRF
jgi:hypothetical protein